MPYLITTVRIATVASLLACYTHALPRAGESDTKPSPYFCPERCQDITILVFASAENVVVPALGILTQPGAVNALLAKAGTVTQTEVESGTFETSARYCRAKGAIGERIEVVEFLLPRGSYTKDYWAGGNFPGFNGDQYSWIKYAERRDYATLSIDELGNGDSSHPNPGEVVQPALQSETIHAIICLLHAGKVGNKEYSKVVLIGHSFGSFTSPRFAQDHPTDLAGLILTGYSHNLSRNVVLQTTSHMSRPSQSCLAALATYPKPILPCPMSLAAPTLSTIPASTIQSSPPSISKMVCGNDTGGSCLPADTSTVAATKAFFLNAESFTYFLANESGHAINFHYLLNRLLGLCMIGLMRRSEVKPVHR